MKGKTEKSRKQRTNYSIALENSPQIDTDTQACGCNVNKYPRKNKRVSILKVAS